MSALGGAMAELVAWEAVSSLGESARETSLLWEAGIVNLAPSRFVLEDGSRVNLCACPALSPELLGEARLAELAACALERLATRMGGAGLQGIRTLLLSLPERLAAQAHGRELNAQGQRLIEALLRHPLFAGQGLRIEAYPFGRAAGALALHRAAELMAAGQRVLWGGLDTLHDWQALEALAKQERLLNEDNVDGVRPGEAAAFAVLQAAQGGGDRPIVMGVGLGREDLAVQQQGGPLRFDGLAKAVMTSTTSLRDLRRRCNYWLFDTTHEAVAAQRLQHVLTACADIVGLQTAIHGPLKALGDVGAASLPLFAALAAEAWRHGSADDNTALLAASSDSSACGAIVLGDSIARMTT
ncbi:MAG: hypothetical protein EKK47_10875 [Burkholderiales bacterium]|jgi:3-oxoacyl-[acyl-carrier-protein] synthase-1|nr:MAG: hypothetical protein EKK47_10875 [Burkholderiales bacterium]